MYGNRPKNCDHLQSLHNFRDGIGFWGSPAMYVKALAYVGKRESVPSCSRIFRKRELDDGEFYRSDGTAPLHGIPLDHSSL
jgi:hypothetical protein